MKGEKLCHKTIGRTTVRWAVCRTTGIGTTILRRISRTAITGILRILIILRTLRILTILRIREIRETTAANRSKMPTTDIRKTSTITTISDKTV